MTAAFLSFLFILHGVTQRTISSFKSIPAELLISHISDRLGMLDLISLLRVDKRTYNTLVHRSIERHGLFFDLQRSPFLLATPLPDYKLQRNGQNGY